MPKSFSLKERARFMKKLSFLLESGIPFLQAVHFMKEREDKIKIKACLLKAINAIQGGLPIHKSFMAEPLLIDAASLRILKNGEMTGSLSKNCLRIARDLESKLANRNRLLSALLYPSFIIVFAFILVAALLLFVFPKILSIIAAENNMLPLPTRMLIGLASFVKEQGIGVLFMSVAAGLIFLFSYRSFFIFKKFIQRLLLAAPLISKIIILERAYHFSKFVSLYLESGYTLSESLYHAEAMETHMLYREAFSRLKDGVRKGNRFSRLLMAEGRFFPKETAQFAALGEESGNLSKTFFQLSLIFDEELREIEKRMFTLLEPVLMLFLGLVVGFIALSLISPIYSLTSSLSQNTP